MPIKLPQAAERAVLRALKSGLRSRCMFEDLHLAHLAINDKLIEEARRPGKHKTKKDAVTAALGEYIQRRK